MQAKKPENGLSQERREIANAKFLYQKPSSVE
jgi:hypothetical protein